MRGRQWTVKLVSVWLALMCVTLGIVTAAPSAGAATATPACTFNGSSTPIVQGVSAGSKVDIVCTGLPALRPYLFLQASLLIGIDPKAAALLSGGSLGAGTLEGALAALPEIDAASFNLLTSDINGDLTFDYTVPTFQPTDPNASCPPSTQEYNAGLIGCAIAMVDLTTQTPLAAGSAVMEYAGFNLLPPDPTLALSAKKSTAGSTVTVSDAPGNTTYWWVATLASLEALLSGGGAPAETLVVNFEHGRNGPFIPAANNIVVTPASYNGTTLTLPSISGSFTVPAGVTGKQKVYVLLEANLEGEGLVNVAHQTLKIKA
jgi:hypothetical protein